MSKIVYIAHPIATDENYTTEQNIQHLLSIIKNINLNDEIQHSFEMHEISITQNGFEPGGKIQILDCKGVVPMAPYIGDVLAMQDDNVSHRKRGIENDTAIIETGIFEEIWLTGYKISLGMQEEIKLFVAQGKKVVNLVGKI